MIRKLFKLKWWEILLVIIMFPVWFIFVMMVYTISLITKLTDD